MKILSNKTNLWVFLFFLLTCFSLYQYSLGFWWAWDDTQILKHALSYQPWQYFFSPESWQILSSANLTPWVSFSFAIDAYLFGHTPAAFYGHQLLALALVVYLSYALLRLYTGLYPALFGSLLFLCAPASVAISQQLMIRHYLEGLLFFIVALYAYIMSLRHAKPVRYYWLSLSVCAFVLAMTAKETYVPLVLLLPFLPEATLKQRLTHFIPYLVLLLAYALWRSFMLESWIGGYQDQAQSLLHLQLQLPVYLSNMLFGTSTYALLAALLVLSAVLYSLWFFRHTRYLILASSVLIAGPLLPVILLLASQSPLNQRLLILPTWAVCMASALIINQLYQRYRPLKLRILLFLAVLFMSFIWVRQAMSVHTILNQQRQAFEVKGRFIAHAKANQVLVDAGDWYAHGALWLRQQSSATAPRLLFDWIEMDQAALPDNEPASEFFQYQTACACIKNITPQLEPQLQQWRSQRKSTAPLSVQLSYQGHHLQWQFGPYTTGSYQIIDPVLFGASPLPAKGQVRTRYPEPQFRFYLRYQSLEGWIRYSPLLTLDFTTTPITLDWVNESAK
ncbi:glycosyltransferase family 39 protein [Candidatus Venteria ishoeyi]|uniref:glycosyltransferase family 39 protein n=1 Tax=Candidatus Venteria ishoeyi TaxID=1899563 RepID=UPI0025A503F7|nr:glycosyltransferase family 39 protein [Candidatus Venteria ishoeyi]MDM8545152.1 glycosyltransferase family 39 protein [Candidatus Venteria ishoeyi]